MMISILTVCTGNICRSPYAERMLQKNLDLANPDTFSVRSAGIQAMVGSPIEETTASHLQQRGGKADGFAARQLTPEMLAEADIVLTMTEEQRTAVISSFPRAMKRVFTILEFAAILEELQADTSIEIPPGSTYTAFERWTAVRKFAALKRFAVKERLNGMLDVADPYRRGDAAFTVMVDALEPALHSIAVFEETQL